MTTSVPSTIETFRLLLRPMRADDFNALFEIFTDPQVMASFDSEPFTPAQMQQWLQRNLDHQTRFDYGLFSVIEKASGRLIGDCGLEQMEVEGQTVAELGYDLRSDVWNRGFATEAASAVRDYAFQVLRLPRLLSLIRVGNAASQRVAEKIGMQREAEFERYGIRYWRYTIQSMNDIQPILKTLQEALLRKMGDEVELIFQYGSHVRGATHRYSDVDLSWVPAHETTWDSITVLVGERLADLYPMHWSKLERMAELRNVSASVLLHSRILYQRDEAAAQRFHSLAARLEALQQPDAQPEMVRRALEIFRTVGYDAYLLRLAAEAAHATACLQHTQAILRTVLHCLAVANQAVVDTRKPEQVLALPRLPADFAATVQRAVAAHEPAELLAASEALLRTTRAFLLAEQRRILRYETTFPVVFDSAYPELKRDLQGILLGCERQDLYSLKTSLLSLYHELSRMLAQALTGVEYGSFNSLAEYEQDLAALGFPALTPHLATGDFAALHRQCLLFDQHLRTFLTERAVELNDFVTLDDLQRFLNAS
jgi:RimJ/RimL family protein N-acetyltransferase/predicted nucleotidyltransferase